MDNLIKCQWKSQQAKNAEYMHKNPETELMSSFVSSLSREGRLRMSLDQAFPCGVWGWCLWSHTRSQWGRTTTVTGDLSLSGDSSKRQKSPIPVSLLQVALPWQGVGLGDLQWSLPTPAIPGFWDSVWSVPAGAAKGGVPLSRLSCGWTEMFPCWKENTNYGILLLWAPEMISWHFHWDGNPPGDIPLSKLWILLWLFHAQRSSGPLIFWSQI